MDIASDVTKLSACRHPSCRQIEEARQNAAAWERTNMNVPRYSIPESSAYFIKQTFDTDLCSHGATLHKEDMSGGGRIVTGIFAPCLTYFCHLTLSVLCIYMLCPNAPALHQAKLGWVSGLVDVEEQ